MEEKFYQCKLEPHLRCDTGMKCLLCTKTESTWADAWIKASKTDKMGALDQRQVIELIPNET